MDSRSDFLETTEDEMAGTSFYMEFGFVSQQRHFLHTLFSEPGFRFVLCSFCCSLLCRLFGFRKFKIKQISSVMATSTVAV